MLRLAGPALKSVLVVKLGAQAEYALACAESGKGGLLVDRRRTQTPSCGELLAIAFALGGVRIVAPLAVERWGVIAFALILVAMVAASFALATTEWVRRKVQDMWLLLMVLFALITSEMAQALGVPFWRSWLIGALIVLAVWLVVSRGLPWWQSRRRSSHQ